MGSLGYELRRSSERREFQVCLSYRGDRCFIMTEHEAKYPNPFSHKGTFKMRELLLVQEAAFKGFSVGEDRILCTEHLPSRLCLVTQPGMYICHICSVMCWWKYCCVALLCAATQHLEAPSLWRLVDPRIILFWWYLFSRKVSFLFRPPVTWRAWKEKRHSNWPWKEGVGTKRGVEM